MRDRAQAARWARDSGSCGARQKQKEGASAPFCSLHGCPNLEHLDVRCRWAFLALLGVVAHFRALGERPEAVALDRALMHGQVLAGLIGRDESKALVVDEPLHGPCRDLYPSWVCALRNAEGATSNDCENAGHCFG
jgi:hypothetical protein